MRLLTFKGLKMDPPRLSRPKTLKELEKNKKYLVAITEYALFEEITIPCLAMHDSFSSQLIFRLLRTPCLVKLL